MRWLPGPDALVPERRLQGVDGSSLASATGTVSGLLVLEIAFVVDRGVINQGVVNRESVLGAVCIYLLLGKFFPFFSSFPA